MFFQIYTDKADEFNKVGDNNQVLTEADLAIGEKNYLFVWNGNALESRGLSIGVHLDLLNWVSWKPYECFDKAQRERKNLRVISTARPFVPR